MNHPNVALAVGNATAAGRRPHNEDACFASQRLLAIADGMGGHAAGDVASAMVIEAIERVAQLPQLDEADVVNALRQANDRIVQFARSAQQERPMGTTFTGLAVVGVAPDEHVVVFNIGDSRTYRFRDGKLTQITRDHSVVQELIAAGEITAEQARSHSQRNVVTKVVGVDGVLDVDVFPVEVQDGDRFLLCSDGLTGGLDDAAIAALLGGDLDRDQLVEALVTGAIEAGSRDNVTVIVADVDIARGSAEVHALDDTDPRGVAIDEGDTAVLALVVPIDEPEPLPEPPAPPIDFVPSSATDDGSIPLPTSPLIESVPMHLSGLTSSDVDESDGDASLDPTGE